MELIKVGNTPAKKVESYKEVEHIVPEFLAFLDQMNGKFSGVHSTCYALAHCQVSDQPLALMVIAKEWTEGTAHEDVPKDQLFRSRVILNPRIVKKPEKTIKLVKVKNPATLKESIEKVAVKNNYKVKEGCMSFPHRTAKNMDRYFEVVVEYQVPQTILGFTRLKKVRETVKGLKAHIFQHECDHMNGINMFYGTRVR